MSEHDHADPHDHGHGVLTVEDRHDHEAEIYDAMAAQMLAELTDEEFLVEASQIPFHNREHVDYLTYAIDQLRPLAGKRILEVGAGSGMLAVYLALQGADVTGIDVSSGHPGGRGQAGRGQRGGGSHPLHPHPHRGVRRPRPTPSTP